MVELGGQWVGPTQHEVLALAEDLGIETYPTARRGQEPLRDRPREAEALRGTIPMLGPLVMADYGRADLRLKRLIKRVSAEAPWEAEDAERLDEQTFATWIRAGRTNEDRARGPRHRLPGRLLGRARRHLPAARPLLRGLAGGWDDLLDTEGGAQQDRLAGGTQLISLRMAEELGDRVELSAPVRAIRTEATGSSPAR